jgi:hypothetical protein
MLKNELNFKIMTTLIGYFPPISSITLVENPLIEKDDFLIIGDTAVVKSIYSYIFMFRENIEQATDLCIEHAMSKVKRSLDLK